MRKTPRLKQRSDFLRAAKAPSCARHGVVIQARPHEDEKKDPLVQDLPSIRLGFTATKRIGGAVVRNRAKRRLRAAAEIMIKSHAKPGHDYVFIARPATADKDWPALLDDIKRALIRLGAPKGP